MDDGTIIVLNGTSSSGKSSIAHALQQTLDEPFLHFDCDQFKGMLPLNRTGEGGDFGMDIAARKLVLGFHRILAAMASSTSAPASGNNVIADGIVLWGYALDHLVH